MLLKYSPDWETFLRRLDVECPQWGKPMTLPFPEKLERLMHEVSGPK
ncbi:MAG TPA: hypothetical protein VIX59_04380 [Candidatus Binataceae bacterium]